MGFDETNEAEVVKKFWFGFAEVALDLAHAFQKDDEVAEKEKLGKFRALSLTMPNLSKWVEEAHQSGTSLAAYMLDLLSR